jgi:hypothetical protein
VPTSTPTPTDTPIPTATSAPTATPTPTPVEKHIVDAYNDGDIEISHSGGDLWEDRFWIYNNKDYPLTIWIPYGVYFKSEDPAYQNLMPLRQYKFEIPAGGSGYIDLMMGCMNFTLLSPPKSGVIKYTPYRIASNDLLYYVSYCLTTVHVLNYEASQAVLWYFTDPGDFGMASVSNYLSDLPESELLAAKAAIAWVEAYVKSH